jgi:hypothetical protein
MTHSTELDRTTVPRGQARVLADAARLIGSSCPFAPRNARAAKGTGQMRRRATVSGGDS